jgi:Family of unknown function (DUF6497)
MAGTDQASLDSGDVPIPVPSGQTVTLLETIWNERGPAGLAIRFRFLAPAISKDTGTITPDQAGADMMALCKDYALKRIGDTTGPTPAQIIISLSDRPVPFGESHPEATQFFDSYDLVDGECVWSLF